VAAGTFPEQLNVQVSGLCVKDMSISSYRFISFLARFFKIFEKVVFKGVYNFLNSNMHAWYY
jgi:hypothetical protein